ncbi:MAG TPA: aspartate kinase, partial [Flavobacteriales bacterium]|nr:aspartate kinase [Flavobacteriales bacterium]
MKDAAGVRNVAEVVKHFSLDDLLIVVSAMGKTTNALEEVTWAYADARSTEALVDAIETTHTTVLREVAPDDAVALLAMEDQFHALRALLKRPPSKDVDRHYDQIVSLGEVWSTMIVSAHLNAAGIGNHWVDAREVVRTDASYRAAKVDWETSAQQAAGLMEGPKRPFRILTQGFIGR